MNTVALSDREFVDAGSLDFDPALAKKLCHYAAQAYQCPDGTVIESTGTETLVNITELPGQVIVAFRGTVDLRNWLTDFEGWQTGFPCFDFGGCTVHAGFWEAWQAIWPMLRESSPIGMSTRPETRTSRSISLATAWARRWQ
jgi:hypothetical protein